MKSIKFTEVLQIVAEKFSDRIVNYLENVTISQFQMDEWSLKTKFVIIKN
jgi:hypothetical protein